MSEFEQHPDIENAQSCSPEELAKQLFQQTPGKKCSICILPGTNGDNDNDVASFNFEILLTIYLEGFMNILQVSKHNYMGSKTNDDEIENDIYKNMTEDDFKFPEPWFNSFGYSIRITEYGKESWTEFNNVIKPFSYCRILLSFTPGDKIHFKLKGLTSKYHFILNGSYKITSKLENIYAVLSKDDKFYKISFIPI